MIFTFDLQNCGTIDQVKDIGYSNCNAILNLSTLAILITIYFFKAALLAVLWIIFKVSGKKLSYSQNLKNEVFYSDLVAIALEGFMELFISGYLQL